MLNICLNKQKQIQYIRKNLMKFIPLLVVLIAILLLTLQRPEGTKALSNETRQTLVRIYEKFNLDPNEAWWNSQLRIRCLAHTVEYFALGLAAGLVFKKKRYALLLCIVISFTDQLIKIFVPTRHFDWHDFPFDLTGFGSAILIMWIISRTRNELNKLENRESEDV